MHFLNHFYLKTLKYDLINIFLHKKIKTIPKIQKIIITLTFKKNDINSISKSIIILKLLTYKNPLIVKSKKATITLKIRKGTPIGCKLILTKKNQYNFMELILFTFVMEFKTKPSIKIKNVKSNIFTFDLTEISKYNLLNKYYPLFNQFSNLKILIILNAQKTNNLFYILHSYKLFILK